MSIDLQNWAGNHAYSAAALHRPRSIEELQTLVRRSRKLKVLGSRHSFNDVADTTGDLVSLEELDLPVTLDRARRTATVPGGITYGQLCCELHREGYSLPNLASLPHICVAGACATATHGSGDRNGILATSVAALEMVTADGERVILSRERDGERFQGAVVGLGALGAVVRLTLDVSPAFAVQQEVYENLPLAELEAHFDAITASAYSVSLFTDWQDDRIGQVWLKRRLEGEAPLEAPREFYGAALSSVPRHPIVTLPADRCTWQLGVPGPWHERLPHFRMEDTPSNGEELQSEYMVPRRHALAAMREVVELRDHLAPLLQISEVRTVAADTLWMSPCRGQPCVGLHFTWMKDWPRVRELLPVIEERLAPFEARPHWGKLFQVAPERLRSLYPRLGDFRELARSFDPDGKFRNAFLERYLF